MTIELPTEIEKSIHETVLNGRFGSIGDAVAAAWRQFRSHDSGGAALETNLIDPVLGSMRDFAVELDEVVSEAVARRRSLTFPVPPLDDATRSP